MVDKTALSPITGTVQSVTFPSTDSSGNAIPGAVMVLVDGSTTPIPANPIVDMAFSVNDRVLIQSWAAGSNTPSSTYIIGRASSSFPTTSVLYHERYILSAFSTNGAVNNTISWQTVPTSGLISTGAQINPFGVTPFSGSGTFTPPIPGLYRISASVKTGNVSSTSNNAMCIVDQTGLTLAFDQGPSSTWGNVWAASLSVDVVLNAGDTIAIQVISDTKGVPFNGMTIQGWPNAGLATFTLVSTQI